MSVYVCDFNIYVKKTLFFNAVTSDPFFRMLFFLQLEVMFSELCIIIF